MQSHIRKRNFSEQVMKYTITELHGDKPSEVTTTIIVDFWWLEPGGDCQVATHAKLGLRVCII